MSEQQNSCSDDRFTRNVLSATPVVDPFTLLDLCLASEGGAAIVVTTLERARHLPHAPDVLLGAEMEWARQQYVDAARYDEVWMIGSEAGRKAFGIAGLGPTDVDVAQLYDVNSLESAGQFEALGFCGTGEDTNFALATGIGPEGKLPICNDGDLLSFSHLGWGAPRLRSPKP